MYLFRSNLTSTARCELIVDPIKPSVRVSRSGNTFDRLLPLAELPIPITLQILCVANYVPLAQCLLHLRGIG